MRCPKCYIKLQAYYAFCPSCGEQIGPDRGRPWKVLGVAAVVAAVVMMALMFYHQSGFQAVRDTQHPVVSPPEKSPRLQVLIPDTEKSGKDFTVSVGRVVIEDIAGNRVAEMTAAVTDSGWLAVPAKLGIGGYNWYFLYSGGEMLEIIGGRIGDHDAVGIWQLRDMNRFSGPRLIAGNPSEPLRWISVVSELALDLPHAGIISEQQNFFVVLLPSSIREPGVFIQGGAVVGWSFGHLLDHGYIWRGPDEESLVYELSVSNYYRTTFENSREERFIQAYAVKDAQPLDKLRLFADGFRRSARLPEQETPPHLSAAAVLARMHGLVSRLARDGRADDLLSVLDSRVLSGAGDVDLLRAVFSNVSRVEGISRAVDIIEEVLRNPGNFLDIEETQIRIFLTEMYGRWLNMLTESGDYAGGLAIYDRAARNAGDDPNLKLMGARMALAFDDWRTAENIMGSQWFPLDMSDQVKQIQDRIRLLKTGSDKIAVRFAPDAGRIGVQAVLNQRLRQGFIVDTGASMVTIPVAAAKQLGLYDASAPKHRVVTAGGVVFAPSVMIGSIGIGGWTETRIEAFVMDLPEYPGIGLLGMNYLNRFKMEVNADDGILTLAPR